MKIMSNVPETPMMVTENYKAFGIGDRVRVQYVAKKYPKYPYSGGGVIGYIKSINHDSFIVDCVLDEKVVKFEDVYIIKKVGDEETFETVPYINKDERDFWRTHWFTRDGIARKDDAIIENINNK